MIITKVVITFSYVYPMEIVARHVQINLRLVRPSRLDFDGSDPSHSLTIEYKNLVPVLSCGLCYVRP